MHPLDLHLSRTALSRAALLTLLAIAGTPQGHAADVTWTNSTGSLAWNASDANWSSGLWSNAAGNGAVFTAAGAGAISVASPVFVDSLNFSANGYTLGGPGAINFVAGSSSAGTGWVNVEPGVTARLNTAVSSSLGFIKGGGGTLELSGPLSLSGPGIPYAVGGVNKRLYNDVIVAGISEYSLGGTLRIMNSSVLPATTRLGIGNGYLDIGNNTVTIAQLNFVNQADGAPWDPTINAAANGVIGTGTLRVTGDINVMGVGAGNDGGNTVATNLDLGGGTQVVRVAGNGNFYLNDALMFTGSLSNGSLLKTFGYTENGILGTPDGMSLYGNNTYTGSTILNGGTTVVTGTNASTLLKVTGGSGPFGSTVTLQGANGSFLQAATIQAFAGSQFIIDNNAAVGAGGYNEPPIPAAQNNNRISDTAEIQLRNGTFAYRGKANTAASETFGKLNVMGGHNTVALTPNGTGSVTLTSSELAMAPRATLQVTSTTLGGTARLYVTGALPAADGTGILTRVVGSNDFLTYNAATGLTPLVAAAYATSFAAGSGANVSLTAASTVASSVNVNAIKSSGVTTTIAAGQTLGVSSGMILNANFGSSTFTGGTVAFGAAPGTFFGGTTTVSSAITGTAGLINANATLTLNGDLSGLSGVITSNATTTLATNTFAGALEVRAGTFNINTSQTLAGQGAIRMGVAENDQHLVGSIPVLGISGAGANAVIGRDIIFDNGSQDAAGAALPYNFLPSISPLTNSSGSQTLSGNIVMNSPGRLQGGGGSGSGSTNFTGNVSGLAMFYVPNGRANFSGNVANAGGFRIGEGGFTAQVTFSGTTTGSAPITLTGGNSTTLSYMPGSLPTGTLTIENGYGSNAPTIIPLATSTINNAIVGNTVDIKTTVNTGITATWTGPVTSGMDGYLIKQGAGTLVLTNAANSVGSTQVNGGTLLVNGGLGGLGVAVNSGGTLGGNGIIAGQILVNAGGQVAPGSSIGTLAADSLDMSGSARLLFEIDLNFGALASADLLKLGSAGVSLGGSSLQLSLANTGGFTGGTYLLLSQDGIGAINGAFGSVLGLPEGYTAAINYAFSGTDALGRIGDGNDLAVTLTAAVPEPSTYALFGAGLLLVSWLRRRHV
jgi:autotransporter-associated beta strand protein